MKKTDFICGIIPAVITPMTPEEELHEKGLEDLLNFLIGAGVDGVFTIGTAGEFWALTVEEKKRVFEWTVGYTDGRVPVYLGTCANTTREAIHLAEAAQEAGASCISVLTPNFIAPNQSQMFNHYRDIARSVDLPVLLYTNPDRTGNDLPVNLVVRLAQEVDNIVGIKDSGGNMSLTAEYLRRTPEDFHVLMGRDTLIFDGLVQGASGAIAASANIAPELSVGIFESLAYGDTRQALEYQRRLDPVRIAFGIGAFPAVLKAGVELRGMTGGPPRAPVGPLSHSERERLRDVLVESGILESDPPDPVIDSDGRSAIEVPAFFD